MSNKPTALLAAGGTGGHLFPALALAEELLKDGWEVIIATDERGARYDKSDLNYQTVVISSGTLKPGLLGKFKAVAALGKGITQSFGIMRKYKPDVVVGFGGYPCFPPLFAAQILKEPTLLHEANAVLGKANKMLAAKANNIALSLPKTKGVTDHKKFKEKAVVTGNPIRSAVVAKQSAPYPTLDAQGEFKIFIMGGSQGARIFSDVIPAAVKLLAKADQQRLHIVQQCREEDMERTQKAYTDMGVKCTLKPFFHDAPQQLADCHLFIGRSGASTVADVAVVGRPAIFVPLKHADHQQKLNADVVADMGGAWVLEGDDFNAKELAKHLVKLMAEPDTLKKAAKNAASAGQPQAARNLANIVKRLGKGTP